MQVSATTHPADPRKLAKYINQALFCNVDYIHFDVMDGRFVADETFDYTKVMQMRNLFPKAKFAIHLMAQNIYKTIEKYLEATPTVVYLHTNSFDSSRLLSKTLAIIKQSGTRTGICIEPETKVQDIDKTILSLVSDILVMGVVPGESGQPLIESTLSKISELKAIDSNLIIAFDGGLNGDNFSKAILAGADNLAFGSYLYKEITSGRGEASIATIKNF